MIAAPMMSGPAGGVLDAIGLVVVAFFVLFHTAGAVLLVSALPELWRQWDPTTEDALTGVMESPALPTVSVVVTGHAGRAWTAAALRSLLALRYPRHEVVLVHDGAESGFLRALIEQFDLYPVPPAILVNVPTGAARGYYRSQRYGKLFVIDKPHVGHADDLNAALNASRFPYVLTMDVRTRLEPDALTRLMRPFLLGEPAASVAGTARVGRVGHGGAEPDVEAELPSDWLGGAQAIEQLREMVFARLGWNRFGGQLPMRGDVQLHRREQLLELDGYRAGVADPERDLVARLRARLRGRLATAMPFLPDAVAWAPAAAPLRAAARIRGGAHRGLVEELSTRSSAADAERPRPGRRAVVALAAVVVAPVMELLGYLLLALALLRGGPSDPFVPLFLVAVPGYALLLSLWAVALEWESGGTLRSWRDAGRLCAVAVTEQVGYRQRIMWARLGATVDALLGRPRTDAGRRSPSPDAAEAHGAADRVQAR